MAIGVQVKDTCRIHSEHFGYRIETLSSYSDNELRLVAYDCAKRMQKSFHARFYETDVKDLYKPFLAYFSEQLHRRLV